MQLFDTAISKDATRYGRKALRAAATLQRTRPEICIFLFFFLMSIFFRSNGSLETCSRKAPTPSRLLPRIACGLGSRRVRPHFRGAPCEFTRAARGDATGCAEMSRRKRAEWLDVAAESTVRFVGGCV